MKRHVLGALLTLAACTDTSGLVSSTPAADASADGASDAGASDSTTSSVDGDAPTTGDAYASAVLADAPVAFFRLRETSTGACKNEVQGSAITCVYPSVGATLAAPGISASGKSVTFTDANTAALTVYGLAAWEGQTTFTVEAWIRYDKAQSRFFARMDNGGTLSRTGSWSYSDIDAGGNVFVTETWKTGGLIFGSRTDIPAADDFMHLVYAFDASIGRDVVYLNATQGSDYFSGGGGVRTAATSPLSFGGFHGSLAEVAIYDKRLAPNRIAAHFAAR